MLETGLFDSLIPTGFHIFWPYILWLSPIPILVYLALPSKKRDEAALLIPTFHTIEHLPSFSGSTAPNYKFFLLFFIWLLTLLAAARPQWIGDPVQMPSTGRDLLLAVDISQSMEIEDMVIGNQQIPRIQAVKTIVGDFVQRRNGDKLGLIVFGTQAYLHVPLTFDRKIVQQQLQEAQLGFAGGKTAIGDAIGVSIKKIRELPKEKSNGRVLILLTDGANTAGEIEPREAARLAKTAGIKIYAIGLGAESMIEKNFFFSREINPSADLDEEMLKYIASETGGEYFRARNPQELARIYQVIDKLEPLPQESETFRPVKELFYYPLSVAFLLSLLWAAIEQILMLKNRYSNA